jgi:outer membrane protein OmpA-like peptidoglycan-associated protein
MPTSDSLFAAARAEPSWNFVIEGHADTTGRNAHNQIHAEKRAFSVNACVVRARVDTNRLTTQDFGPANQ